MKRRVISIFLALSLVSPVSLAMETPNKYLVAGSILATLGAVLGITTSVYLAEDKNYSSQKHNGLIAGDVIGWAICATGIGLFITGLAQKCCPPTSKILPPSKEPTHTNPGTTLPARPQPQPPAIGGGVIVIPVEA